jgi:hypothetical protein
MGRHSQVTFEDRQREAMTDFNRSSYAYVRELLAAGVKRAQAEADIRRYELEEYERANGFRRPSREAECMFGCSNCGSEYWRRQDALACCAKAKRAEQRLDASRAYREVTGRDAFAGAETYTRRNAEDIHD